VDGLKDIVLKDGRVAEIAEPGKSSLKGEWLAPESSDATPKG
jgi:hypothetical protein